MAVAAVASLAPSILLSEGAWAQTDESLRPFNPNGMLLSEYSGNGSHTGDTWYTPRDAASGDNGRLMVADTGSYARHIVAGQRIVVLNDDYTLNGTTGLRNTTTDKPLRGMGGGEFDNPGGVAVNQSGHIFVADRDNDRIQILNPDGSFAGQFNGSDVPLRDWRNTTSTLVRDMLGDYDAVRDVQGKPFVQPLDVELGSDGNIYVTFTGSNAILYFNATTYEFEGMVGSRYDRDGDTLPFVPHGGISVYGRFSGAGGMDIGAGGLLALAEVSHYIVNVLDPADDYKTVFVVGTPGENGTDDGLFGLNTGGLDSNGNPIILATGPRSVSFSNDGNLLAVSDPANKRFQVFQLNTTSDGRATGLLHPDGKPAFVLDVPSYSTTLAVEFDSDDRLVTTRSGQLTSLLEVYDVTLPAVRNVTVAVSGGADGSKVLLPSGSFVVDVEFNTNLVRVNSTAGTPYLAIGPEHIATLVPYDYNETTRMLQFEYEVKEGDRPEHFVYNTATALTLNGSTITAGARNVTALTNLPNPDNAAGNRSLLIDHGITVDAVGPELVNAYSPNASAAYPAGSRIEIVLNYTEPARIIGPAPTLALDVGAAGDAKRFADYFRGNNTERLEFNYTVQEGDNTESGGLRYAGTDALDLDGIQIQDRYGNPARPLPPPAPLVDETGAAVDIAVDTMPPSVQSVAAVSDAGEYGADDTVEIAVVFDEPVNATGSPTLALDMDPPRSATYVNGSDGDASLMFRYVVQENDTALDGLRYSGTDALRANGGMIADVAGNMADLALLTPGTPGYSLADIIINGSVADMVNPTDPGDGGTPGTGDGGTPGTGDGGTPGGQNATLTCSIALGKSVSDMDVRPGERSTEASQTVMNSGTAPFMAVVLEAEPWYVDLPANTTLASARGMDPAPDMLPASLTEVRLGNGTDAMYAALPENGTAAVVGALAPGAAYDLSFKLDLTGQASAPGSTLTQFIEYTAECSDSQ